MTFQCLWTQRDLPQKLKPSKTGVMAYYVESQYGPTVFITETQSCAFRQHPEAKDAALDLASKKKMAAIVSTYEGLATAMVP